MANQKTQRMGKAVWDEALRLLGERVADPTLRWDDRKLKNGDIENTAGILLQDAGFLRRTHPYRITLAGMDYHRRETTRFRWARENWFPVFVAVLTAGATLGTGILTIWFGNRPW